MQQANIVYHFARVKLNILATHYDHLKLNPFRLIIYIETLLTRRLKNIFFCCKSIFCTRFNLKRQKLVIITQFVCRAMRRSIGRLHKTHKMGSAVD